ncbi:hypothetical protein BH23ACT5_BH23ACT5_02720 [soil metagenome]
MTLARRLGRSWLWVAPLGAIVALLVIPTDDGSTICPFALTTGVACPGCGLTRAAAWLVRGDLGSALSYHPLVFVVGVWLGGWWATAVAQRLGRRISLPAVPVERLLVATAALFAVTWLLRLSMGSLPPV